MVIHEGPASQRKNYKCGYCGRSFTRNDKMKDHQKKCLKKTNETRTHVQSKPKNGSKLPKTGNYLNTNLPVRLANAPIPAFIQ